MDHIWLTLALLTAAAAGFVASEFRRRRTPDSPQPLAAVGTITITGIQGQQGWNIPKGIYTVLASIGNLPPEVIGKEGQGFAFIPAEVPADPLVIPQGATPMTLVANQWTWDGVNDNPTRNNQNRVVRLWLVLTLIDNAATRAVVYLPD